MNELICEFNTLVLTDEDRYIHDIREGNELTICSFSSETNWNAEDDGQEPDYLEFADFLRDLIFSWAGEYPITTSLTYGVRLRGENLPKISYKYYPIYTIDKLIHWIYKKLGFKKGYGTEIEFSLNNPNDFNELLKAYGSRSSYGNNWLFLTIGNKEMKNWNEFRPYYLQKEEKGLDGLAPVGGNYFVVFHEMNINYCEIMSFQINQAVMEEKLTKLKSQYPLKLLS
ncbi:MAG: hypothetical protein OEZ51_11865 [Nitrospinota bacterium]|nr:hypothetical protein [Nitrospinota bacterium]